MPIIGSLQSDRFRVRNDDSYRSKREATAMFGNQFIQDRQFSSLDALGADLSSYYFKSCNFSGLQMDGGDFSAAMIFCHVDDSDFYWTNFLQTIVVRGHFRSATFRGSAFSGTRFIECSFENCDFTEDNMGSSCSFDDTVFFRCTFTNTKGIPNESLIA